MNECIEVVQAASQSAFSMGVAFGAVLYAVARFGWDRIRGDR